MSYSSIIALLPYQSPFLFVEELTLVTENTAEGSYTFKKNEYFYKGHFKDLPVTPGVILTEVMAQIGVVCLGIYLLNKENKNPEGLQIALTSYQVDFYKPVFPLEKVTVKSEKIYFRFHKLKCKVQLLNEKDELVCRGIIAGMLT